MRLNMNNHYKNQSVNTDFEGIADDIELVVKKFRFRIAKRVYYKITFKYEDNTSSILLNKEQLEQLSINLNKYIAEGKHLKRTDSKASVLEAKI